MKLIYRRILLFIILVIALVGVFGYMSLEYYFADFHKTVETKVVGLPSDFQPLARPAYKGRHPALQDRNHDPFPYPIKPGEVGPLEPLFSGPLQYPFLCGVEASGLGQPLVDNQEGIGVPVFKLDHNKEKTREITGYSKDCQIPTQVRYFYNRKDTDEFYPLEEADQDIEQIEINGQWVDFIVRVETGVINRFIYTIAALRGDHWNHKLAYQFDGGVGIGKRQGKLKSANFLTGQKDVLALGYAIAASTGNQTSNHYNLWIAEEVMMRVKNQFTALYGKPDYTVGIGGSGGAIQQLILAQNHPGLLDGAIALYAYPDMISQTIYAFDCELLEYYFDVIGRKNPKWRHWKNRRWVQGLNAKEDHSNKYSYYFDLARLIHGAQPLIADGMTECVNGWRGLVQLTNNPNFTHLAPYYAKDVLKRVAWTHWDDLRSIYGTTPSGYAAQAWDNVGVQYGLEALKKGYITPKEFLHLNANIGGWKPPEAMKQERYWKITQNTDLFEFSPWSHHNMMLSNNGGKTPAKRTHGNKEAIEAVFRSGHVFTGKLEIPIIDLRHYLEDELDMHHVSASFSIRQRIQDAGGDAAQHVMWVTRKPHVPIIEALEVMDKWIKRKQVGLTLVNAKPAEAMDRCYREDGSVIAEGSSVWDGPWNSKPADACTQHYPYYQNSRIIAGDSWAVATFKCALQPVEKALREGVYGPVDMSPHLERLQQIFPEGVCDYQKLDLVRLSGLK